MVAGETNYAHPHNRLLPHHPFGKNISLSESVVLINLRCATDRLNVQIGFSVVTHRRSD